MSQATDYDVANASGALVRADINTILGAAVTQNSGAGAPATMYPYMWWADTTNGLLKQRNAANTAWVTIGTLGSANLGHALDSALTSHTGGASGVHGVTGSVVGTSDTQTLTNKTFTDPTITAINGGPVGGLRNLLINGGFDVWQRDTSVTVSAGTEVYTADRYLVGAAGASVTVSRQAGRATTAYSARLLGQSGVTSAYINQRIEATSSRLLGGTITMTAVVYNGTGGSITPTYEAYVPTAMDNYSSVTQVATGDLQACADGQWTEVSVTFTPSTEPTTGLMPRIGFGGALDGAGKYIQITEWQVEKGGQETPFEVRPIALELALCQRYFRVWGGQNSVEFLPGLAMGLSTTTANLLIGYPTMRAAPTVTISAAGDWGTSSSSAFTSCSALSASVITRDTLRLEITVGSAALTADAPYQFRANSTTSARINLSAEL